MNDKGKKIGNLDLVFQNFAHLLTNQAEEQNKREEKRAIETNKILNELTKSVDRLTISHIETQKDQEYSNSRMNRYEEYQAANNIIIKELSDTTLLLSERVKNQRGIIQRALEAIVVVVTAVGITKFT